MADHVVAFARTDGEGGAAIAIAPRLCLGLLAGATEPVVAASRWEGTVIRLPETLAGRTWRNVLTEETLAASPAIGLGEALSTLPFALIEAA